MQQAPEELNAPILVFMLGRLNAEDWHSADPAIALRPQTLKPRFRTLRVLDFERKGGWAITQTPIPRLPPPPLQSPPTLESNCRRYVYQIQVRNPALL